LVRMSFACEYKTNIFVKKNKNDEKSMRMMRNTIY
jgi:hypothetical protein